MHATGAERWRKRNTHPLGVCSLSWVGSPGTAGDLQVGPGKLRRLQTQVRAARASATTAARHCTVTTQLDKVGSSNPSTMPCWRWHCKDGNPANFWTYRDEDVGGYLAGLARIQGGYGFGFSLGFWVYGLGFRV